MSSPYECPNCGSLETLRTKDDKYECSKCKARWNPFGILQADEPVEAPPEDEFRAEMHVRGDKPVAFIYFGSEARGSVELRTREEVDAWRQGMKELNSIFKRLSSK